MSKNNKEQKPRTIIDKIWDSHIVKDEQNGMGIVYIDLHLIHEVTSPQAFTELRTRGLVVHQPQKTFATIDHAVPTLGKTKPVNTRLGFADELSLKQIAALRENCIEFGVQIFDLDNNHQGIVHVIGPELGLTQPGMTIVCGDSHTATHGAFGALAFGIGTTEVGHVLATQSLIQQKPKSCQVNINGPIPQGVTAKDIILKIIHDLGVDGGVGYAFEYTGKAVRGLDMDSRMTICNMSIEAGARSGLIAPDETTYAYLQTRPFSPARNWDKAVNRWETFRSDLGAVYAKSVEISIDDLRPMITYGTNPSMCIPIDGVIPNDSKFKTQVEKEAFNKALQYMNFHPADRMIDKPIDVIFIGSCTNGRLSDLKEAAEIFKGNKKAPNVTAIIVPGSQQVKKQAEDLGLDRIFKAAGAEWREPGCSMCIGMNGDQVRPGHYAISTSNRNFVGRQGKDARTLLASPATAAASALKGRVTDPREMSARI